ncbi:hypothetical protein [Thermostichus vulcanus]|uniref:hypothetical protein n=1 Tax=Thermostichus vulcanus TaxID=32053 RepID=UPI001FCC58F3|nr:hypothetical protein [Thermostichus vulcanus]
MLLPIKLNAKEPRDPLAQNPPTWRAGSWRWRWLRLGLSGATVLGLGLFSQPALSQAKGERCWAEPQLWAEGLTEQLPLFLNLALSRSRSEFQVVLVGEPEVEPLEDLPIPTTGSPPQGFRLYFTTLERRLVLDPTPDTDTKKGQNPLAGRRTENIQLAYEAYLIRSTPRDPWQLVRLQVTGSGVPIRDVTEGITAQAIRSWQQAGCPLTGDLELTKPSF